MRRKWGPSQRVLSQRGLDHGGFDPELDRKRAVSLPRALRVFFFVSSVLVTLADVSAPSAA
jgi:hypothetical protein